MAVINPLKFIQEVRNETRKVVWPTRNETLVTTIMVFIFAIIASLFFFLADQVLNLIVTSLLGLAG